MADKPKKKRRKKSELLRVDSKDADKFVVRQYPHMVHPDVDPFAPNGGRIRSVEDFTPEIWEKLKECFAMNYTKEEAAAYCGVSERALKHLFLKFPLLEEQYRELRNLTSAIAKKNISVAIAKGDLDTSRWYLERTHPEFKKTADVQNVTMVKVAMKFGDTDVVIDTEAEDV